MLKKILIAIVILGIIGGGTAYVLIADPFGWKPKTETSPGAPTTGTYKEQAAFTQKQTQVDKLVAAGDKGSVQEADTIMNAETESAAKSQSDAYIVESNLAKASLYINTGRAQKALDEVLSPLLQRYGNNTTYKYDVYGYMSWVYRELGDSKKAEQYYKMIPEKDLGS